MFCIEVFVAAEEKAWWCRSALEEEGEVASLTFLVMETQVVFCSPSFSCSSHFAASAVPPPARCTPSPVPAPHCTPGCRTAHPPQGRARLCVTGGTSFSWQKKPMESGQSCQSPPEGN